MISKKPKNKSSNSLLYIIICFLLLACLGEIIFLLLASSYKKDSITEFIPPLHNLLPTPSGKIEPEITKIKNTQNPAKRVSLYIQLINRVGPVNAQNDLYLSGITFDGSAHLLNHTVGEWLYDHYKSSGIIYCKDYFLSSCYHGFIIKAITKNGFQELSTIMEKCKSVGLSTGMQCAHAIGHGLLAFDGYKNLTKALTDCDAVAKLSNNFPSFNCYDGVFMENVFGVHLGYPSPDRWINNYDPAFPCDDPGIDKKYISACWLNQPQLMYFIMQGNFQRIGQECLKLSNKDYQLNCFDSASRQMTPSSNGNIEVIFKYCQLMPKDWIAYCITSDANAFLSQGDKLLPFTLCSKLQNQQQINCYNKLASQIPALTKINTPDRITLCGKIPDSNFRSYCLQAI